MDNAEQPVSDARRNGAGAKLLIQAAAGRLRGLAPHIRVRRSQFHGQSHQPRQTGMTLRQDGHGAYGFLRLLHVEAGYSATGLLWSSNPGPNLVEARRPEDEGSGLRTFWNCFFSEGTAPT